jgi:hypothetical protein
MQPSRLRPLGLLRRSAALGLSGVLFTAVGCGESAGTLPIRGAGGEGTAGGPGAESGSGGSSGDAASAAGGGGGGSTAGSGAGGSAPAAPHGFRNVRIGGGGYVTGLVYHPTAEGVVFARTDVGGLYRYDPAKSEWVPLLDWIGRTNAHHYGILSVAVDAQDPSKIYAMAGTNTDPTWAGKGALLRSKDGGDTWEKLDLAGAAVGGLAGVWVGANEEGRGTGERLVVDPNLGTTLFMGTTKAGLWKSVDGGSTWAQVTGMGLTAETHVLFVHVDAASGASGMASQTVLVSTSAGVLLSKDGGATFAPLAGQPAGEMGIRASQSGATIYLTYSSNAGPNNSESDGGGVYVMSTADFTLSDVTPTAWASAYGGVSADPKDPKHVIVSSLFNWNKEDVYESKDGGATWKALGVDAVIDASAYPHVKGSHIHWVTDLKLDPLNPSRFSFVTGQGVYSCKGLDATLACTFDDAGLEELVPLQLVSPPEGPPLISVVGDRDGFRHDDLAVSPPVFAPKKGTTRSLAVAWKAPKVLVKTFDVAPFGAISTDGAVTWKDFATYPASTVNCVEYFCGLRNIAVSADGDTVVWSPVSAATSMSTDAGATWKASTGITATLPKLPPKPVADTVNGDKFYAFDVMSGIVYRSADSGATFAASTFVLPHAAADWYAANFEMAPVPGQEGHLWVAAADGNASGAMGGAGLYRSSDAGETFTRVSEAHVTAAFRLGFGAAGAGAAYPAVYVFGTVDGADGVFRSVDEGATWKRLNDDRNQFGTIHQVIGDPKTFGRVYVAAEGRGILYATFE